LQFPTPVVDFRSKALDASFGGIAMRGVAAAIIATIIIGALFFGREVFVPIALAILLSFVLAAHWTAPAVAHSAWTIGCQRRSARIYEHFRAWQRNRDAGD
jgi:hypothetical protein